jgi:hypothetical protein
LAATIATSLLETGSPPNIASPVARLERERGAAHHSKHLLREGASDINAEASARERVM